MLLLPLLLILSASPVPAAVQEPAPNVLVVMADDFGIDLVNAYGQASAPPCTPTIDGLAADGLLFRNAFANPTCAPTRAALMTGRYGFRTGLGTVGGGGQLALAETTVAEALRASTAGYATAALGKWHLAGGNHLSHPNDSGFDHYAGAIGGGVSDYQSWSKVTNGVASAQPVTTYVTVETTDDALAAVASLPEPWFIYVAYNAPHTPFHSPPAALCPPASACSNAYCGNLGPNPSSASMAKAMVEVMDDQLGRLVAMVDPADTYVMFLGDNGTASQATEAPFASNEAKGSVFQGGVNVPFIVRGPGVIQGESEALVGVTDLFATIGELTGTGLTAEDSVSFAPVLTHPGTSTRRTLYAERFEPNNSTLPIALHNIALREERYKLVRRPGVADRMYDLMIDPFENQNLLPGANAEELAAYDRLLAELEALHTGADLVALPATASISSGGAQQLVLAPGPAHAGHLHLVIGSASGTAPGTSVDGLSLALNPDGYSALTLNGANGPVFQNTLGLVSAQGTAGATIAVPPGLSSALAGVLLQHAYIVVDPMVGTAGLTSAPVALTLAP